jgi:hypothetical protein
MEKRNELTLVSARKINGTKIELEFTQVVTTGEERQVNLLSLLNASDERFTQSGKQTHCWLSAEPQDATNLFNIDFSGLVELGDSMELDVVVGQVQGKDMNIQIIESTDGTKYEIANMDKSAKRVCKDGAFILTAEGAFIYRRATIVLGEPKHFVFENTVRHTPAVNVAQA